METDRRELFAHRVHRLADVAEVIHSAYHTALFAAEPRPWTMIFSRWQNWTTSQTIRKYPARSSFSIIASSFSICACAFPVSGRKRAVAPFHATLRRNDMSLSPGGSGYC